MYGRMGQASTDMILLCTAWEGLPEACKEWIRKDQDIDVFDCDNNCAAIYTRFALFKLVRK